MEQSELTAREEQRILGKLHNRDKTAFNQVFLIYYSGMCLFAEGYVGKEYAEDIVNDVFLKLYQREHAFRDMSHLKAYLYRAVKHSCLDLLKTNIHAGERQLHFVDARDTVEPAYLSHIMKTEAIRILHQALSRLPEETALVLKLTYLQGMSNQEAADELGVSINTIKTHKQRGLQKLRQILPKDQFTILLMFFF